MRKHFCMSDVHGDFPHFDEMLEKIRFSEEDILYVLGDAIDRGNENLKLLEFIRKHDSNIRLLKGNHEYFMWLYLKGDLPARQWDLWGGTECREEVDRLSTEERQELKRYLETLSYSEVIEGEEKKWIGTHTGFHKAYCKMDDRGRIAVELSINNAVRHAPFEYLLSTDLYDEFDEQDFDLPVIAGHLPTIWITGAPEIYRAKAYIGIDTGNGYRGQGGRLACYCLEEDKAYYV